MNRTSAFLLSFALCAALASAQQSNSDPSQAPAPYQAIPTDPLYRLTPGDHVYVNVFQEPDMSAGRQLDIAGKVRLPYVDEVELAGYSVREAEKVLETIYRERELLKAPQVTIELRGSAIREVSITGAVGSPGFFQFPKETMTMDIVEVITRVGGFRPTAKSDMVTVTRTLPDGKKTDIPVNVEAMMSGRGRGTPRVFPIYPGDRISVPERLF